MTDGELAQACVKAGVGSTYGDTGWYWTPGMETRIEANQFVRSWLVAGALMEKFPYVECVMVDPGWHAEVEPSWADSAKNNVHASGDNLPRAIIEACCEALKVIENE